MIVELRASPPAATGTAEREVAELYRLHFGYVWQVLQKLGVRAASLEDAAHDVFVVAHRRWGDFEGRSSARTWLFAVARRLAHRYRRAEFRRRRRRAALALVPQPAVVEPDAALQLTEAWQALLVFLGELDPMHREVFLLGEVEGYSRTEMGRALGISPNTAYSRLRAARRRFAQRFPDPKRREHVRSASAPPSRPVQRRGRALLLAHFAASRATALSGVMVAIGSVGMLAGVVAAAIAWAPRSHGDELGRAERTEVKAPAKAPADLSSSPPAPVQSDESEPASLVEPSVPHPGKPLARAPAAKSTAVSKGAAALAPRGAAVSRPIAGSADETVGLADLDPAMAELARARRALQGHRPQAALSLLERSRRLDVSGSFVTERSVTRVWALCAAGHAQAAASEIRRLQQSGNAAAYASVLSGSCVGHMISSPSPGDQGG